MKISMSNVALNLAGDVCGIRLIQAASAKFVRIALDKPHSKFSTIKAGSTSIN
jgi:hypothetical protein